MEENGGKLARRDQPWSDALSVISTPPSNFWGAGFREAHLMDYVVILRKHVWLSLAFLLTVVSVVTLATFKERPVYVASAQIEIERETSSMLPYQGATPEDYYTDMDQYLETQLRILQSETLGLGTIQSLQLWKNPEFASDPAELPPVQAAARLVLHKSPTILGQFLGGLSVRRIPSTHLLQVSYESHDPQLAAQIVNGHLQNYIDTSYRARYESTLRASNWLAEQMNDFKAKVEKSEDARITYERQNQIWTIDEKQDTTTQKLSEINKELTAAQADRMKAEANFGLVQTSDLDALPAIQQNVLIQDLLKRRADLTNQYNEALNTFGPKYPKVERIQAQLNELSNDLVKEKRYVAKQVESEYNAALKREQLLKDALAQQKQEASASAEKMVQYNILKREAETNQHMYDDLLQKLKEAGISAGLRSSNLRIVDPAMIPSVPSRPQKMRDISLAFIVGLVGGIGLAFLREYLDNTVKTPDDVQYLANLPSLAVVPSQPGLNGHGRRGRILKEGQTSESNRVELVSHERPQSQMAEAFRALRTSLLLSRAENPPQIILVTSALPKEGKTTAAVNLAVTLAQRGDRTLLVDGDLRKPGIARLMDLADKKHFGLSSYLAGACSLEQSTYHDALVPGLSVIPSGPIPPNPADLLSSQRLIDAISYLRREFRFVVLDSPPIMAATDAVILSTWADGVLLVVRSGDTPKGAFLRTRDLLAGVKCRMLGVVLNAIDTTSPDYYYSYKYYPYHYGGYGADEAAESKSESESHDSEN